MSCGPRHTVLTAGRTSGGSCNLGGGRVGVASVSSGRHPSCGINNGRTNFSSWSHVGGGGRSHFSTGSCSGAFVGGGHVGGSGGFGAGSHVGSGGGHVGMVCGMPGGVAGGVPAGMVGGMGGVVGGVPAGMVGGMGGVVGGVPAGMVGGMGGVVGGVPAGMVGGMGGVVGGVPAGMVGGPCGVVGGVPAEMVGGMGGAVGGVHAGMVGGMGGAVGGVHAGMVGGMGGVVGGAPAGMVGGPHTVVGGVPTGMVGGMGGVVPGPAVIGGLGGEHVCGGNFDGKMTMQNLNDRLASYLDKVRCLEEENAELECRIRDFYAKQGPLCEPKDYTHYHQKIEDLKNQLICTSVENNKLLLCIDNSKLTADDFRTKFETECCLRQNVEADINGLHHILDQLTACRANLDVQCENLQDELCGLKKNHKEEVTCLKSQSTGDVNVEVNASPGPDLKKILEEMRCKYEAMIEGNRKEVEAWYESKMEEVNRDVCTSSQEIEESNNKVTELRRQLQTLEIDFEAQCSLRDTLEGSLGETELRYNKHLAELQERISCLEQQLAELRAEMECQNHDYTELLDVKSRLEQEIATYRGLLEGGQHDIIGGGGAARASSASGRRSDDIRTSHTYVTHSMGHPCHGAHLHH